MRQLGSSTVATIIGAGAGALALAAVAVVHPPLPSDRMALPDRTSATIVRDFAKKMIGDFAAFALPAPDRAAPALELAYDIELVRNGVRDVPQVFPASLPSGLIDMHHAPQRKDRFLTLVLPLVLKANDEIAADRARLATLAERMTAKTPLSAEDRAWLAGAAERYGSDNIDELLRRVDIIPPSLALAQAAEESGWGTSRFAHEGNALFGQRTYGDEAGLTPAERAEEESFRVRAYENLGAAVRSYARNLNTHPAYAPFRAARAAARTQGAPVGGHALAATLARYSERGHAYVNALRAIIRLNRLEAFDKARLGEPI